MVIFWNLAGVPFVRPLFYSSTPYADLHLQSYVYSVVYMASHDPSSYRFSTPTYVLLYTTLCSAYYAYVTRPLDSLSLLIIYAVGIAQCPRKVALRCKHRGSPHSGIRSLNFLVVSSRTLRTSRLLTGMLSLLRWYGLLTNGYPV